MEGLTDRMKYSEEWTRKYRPTDLDNYIGNHIIKQMLQANALKGTIPQKLLFYGHFGSGKTTVARIASKYIQCLNPLPDGSPCNECKTCKDITEKLILNAKSTGGVIEYNMSELTKKSDVSIILDKIKIVPPAPYKKIVIILDEIQELSSSAQQSMLKILEEPPKNVYFIICTTNPEKLLPTVKSRVQQFRVSRPTVSDLTGLLENICQKEGVKYSKQGLRTIAIRMKAPRDCIKLLESVYKTFGEVTAENTENLLDVVSDNIYMEYIETLINSRERIKDDTSSIINIINFLEKLDMEYTIEPLPFIKGLNQFLLDMLKARYGSTDVSQKIKKFSKENPLFKDSDIYYLLDNFTEALKLIVFNSDFATTMLYNISIKFINKNLEDLSKVKDELFTENSKAENNYIEKSKELMKEKSKSLFNPTEVLSLEDILEFTDASELE